MEGHVGKLIGPRFHALPFDRAQIIFPKEFRIRQARRQHLLVACQNGGTLIGGFHIGDGDETFDPACFLIAHRKEFLVLFHRRLQHFGRQAKESIINLAHQHHRPFDQSCDLGQQTTVFDHLKPKRKGLMGGVMPDRLGPFIGAQDDLGAL